MEELYGVVVFAAGDGVASDEEQQFFFRRRRVRITIRLLWWQLCGVELGVNRREVHQLQLLWEDPIRLVIGGFLVRRSGLFPIHRDNRFRLGGIDRLADN